jgi:hypothetical protein
MKWRVRIRRVLLASAAVGVLAAAAIVPIGVFAAPVASAPATAAPDDGGRIPWELSGSIFSECPYSFENPDGMGVGWGTDALGEWYVSLFDGKGSEIPEDRIGENYPELVEPIRQFHECLNRFPTTPYSDPPTLSPAQREMYWAYLLTELAPCLRNHGYEVALPSHRMFANTDASSWYLETIQAYDGSVPLDELLTVWRECPIYPSYLEPRSARDGSVMFQQAG